MMRDLLYRFSLILYLMNMYSPQLVHSNYTEVIPDYLYQFPRDHGSHEDFRTEWWYFTGNLGSTQGVSFGYQLTFFRQATVPPPKIPDTDSTLRADQIYVAHFAISHKQNQVHKFWERTGREGLGQAAFSTRKLDIRMGNWLAVMDNDGNIRLSVEGHTDGSSIGLRLKPLKPLVIHGEDGVDQKSEHEGHASHYVSCTRFETEGHLVWQGTKYPVTGQSWMDHEFFSNAFSGGLEGWDWFALQLDNGEDYMLYRLRDREGAANSSSSGARVMENGELQALDSTEFRIISTGRWKSPETGTVYPMGWNVELPELNGNLSIQPAFHNQEMQTRKVLGTVYWEGAVRVTGTLGTHEVRGTGYVELVGYDRPIRGF
jgi:predicted secreted hydrolase